MIPTALAILIARQTITGMAHISYFEHRCEGIFRRLAIELGRK